MSDSDRIPKVVFSRMTTSSPISRALRIKPPKCSILTRRPSFTVSSSCFLPNHWRASRQTRNITVRGGPKNLYLNRHPPIPKAMAENSPETLTQQIIPVLLKIFFHLFPEGYSRWLCMVIPLLKIPAPSPSESRPTPKQTKLHKPDYRVAVIRTAMHNDQGKHSVDRAPGDPGNTRGKRENSGMILEKEAVP